MWRLFRQRSYSRVASSQLYTEASFSVVPSHRVIQLPPRRMKSGRRCKHQQSATASYYRGGTSRALMFHGDSLPSDISRWPAIFCAALGSPDPHGRQLDGLGGGISSLSKICVVRRSFREDADVDFTFAAVGIKDGDVDMSANCGNMISAIGPFAVDTAILDVNSLVQHDDATYADGSSMDVNTVVVVRIHNTNTGKIVHSTFPVIITNGHAEAQSDGDLAIDGVVGTAARIKLDFRDPGGSKTGKLLPTGSAVDMFHGKEATCIDVANPAIFVRASDFGVDGALLPEQAASHPTLLEELDRVRRSAAVKMGVGTSEDKVPGSIPKICLVAPSATHVLISGEEQTNEEVDVLVRAISVGQPHKAIPITMALAAASAARLEGSIVNEMLSKDKADPAGVTIGHASGKILVSSVFDGSGKLEAATVYRTARRLMEGTVYWRDHAE